METNLNKTTEMPQQQTKKSKKNLADHVNECKNLRLVRNAGMACRKSSKLEQSLKAGFGEIFCSLWPNAKPTACQNRIPGLCTRTIPSARTRPFQTQLEDRSLPIPQSVAAKTAQIQVVFVWLFAPCVRTLWIP
jgi:hypothetical protein